MRWAGAEAPTHRHDSEGRGDEAGAGDDGRGQRVAAGGVGAEAVHHEPDAELVAGDAYVGALVRRGLAVPVRGKNGEVKLMPVAKVPAAQAKSGKAPVRAEAGGTRVRPQGKTDTSGRVSAALASGDGEAAIMALFDSAA